MKKIDSGTFKWKKKKKYPLITKVPTVFQMESTECGAASLAMIMQYYGVYVPLEQLRIDTGVSRDGCKANRILQGARQYGFETKGLKAGIFSIFEMPPPFIIHWNFNHFLVYEGRNGDNIYLNDPAEGKRIVSVKEFSHAYTGIVLTIKPTNKVIKTKSDYSITKTLKQKIGSSNKDIRYQLIFGLVLVIPGIILPIFSQVFIDIVMVQNNLSIALKIILLMICVAGIRAVFSQYRNLKIEQLQMKMSFLSSMKFIKHMLHLPMFFYSQRGAGDLSVRIENDNHMNEFLGSRLTNIVINCIMTLVYLIIMFFYSKQLTLIFLLFVVIYAIIMWGNSLLLSKNVMKVQQDKGAMLSNIYSGVNIISTLIASGNEDKYVSRVLGYYAKYMIRKQKNLKIQKVVNAISEKNETICQTILLLCGGCMVIQGIFSIGELVAFLSFMSIIIQPLNELFKVSEDIQTMKADMSRVNDIIHYKNNEISKEKLEFSENIVESTGEKLEGDILMKDITFGYSRLEQPLIGKFNLHLYPGRSVAFVGSSGSGKSTISKLASGLYKPWSGEIIMDGVLLEQIPKYTRCCSVGTVSQDIMLFTGSIRDNITLWNTGIREENVIRAAKDAMIHEEILQKEGAYDYSLEEGGRNISGGQRQRIEIARALVTNPSVLIMDEATSALDSITENAIINNIKRRGCTCIIVSHRLSAIRDCDEIIVMQEGEIIQRGTHEHLMNIKGKYQTLFTSM